MSRTQGLATRCGAGVRRVRTSGSGPGGPEGPPSRSSGRAMSNRVLSQSSHTYLERNTSEFMKRRLNELVKWSAHLERGTSYRAGPNYKDIYIGIIGKDLEFMNYNDDVSPFLEDLEERRQRKALSAQPADEPMEH
ncbi:Proteasome subunit alpha type-1 [Galemys pyrenaicus]|uniref:Proteasome subunit alpha type-1 n=1 Tax=Galemys pyrenaicus TaxID=202257 RepID=A0A8J6ARJ0_GALPY|nr:Proteasome subunit alpha type-1 [Galemys pyrenaicus]